MSPTTVPPIPVLLAGLLGAHGLRKRSLSISGAIAALIVGSSMFAVPLRTFGITLITFYLLGSRATKFEAKHKRTLEEGFDDGGRRSAWQVLCNSFSAFVAAILWSAYFVRPERDVYSWAASSVVEMAGYAPLTIKTYDPTKWCAISPANGGGWSRALIFVALG
jgi:uncharacterized membrane protein